MISDYSVDYLYTFIRVDLEEHALLHTDNPTKVFINTINRFILGSIEKIKIHCMKLIKKVCRSHMTSSHVRNKFAVPNLFLTSGIVLAWW